MNAGVLTRIMGFILVCIGVQFIGMAVIDVARDQFAGAPELGTSMGVPVSK